jgi:hypothetical protein
MGSEPMTVEAWKAMPAKTAAAARRSKRCRIESGCGGRPS